MCALSADGSAVPQTDLLQPGHGVEQPHVQLGVVLGQRLVTVVVDELHHRAERQRVGKAVLSLSVEDFNQLVVAPFPEKRNTEILIMKAVRGVALFHM